MSTIQQKKSAVTEAFGKAAAAALLDIEKSAPVNDVPAAKLQRQNTKGEMLMCKLTIAKRPMAPDPLCVTTNEEIRYIKRGKEVLVPWYVVQQMKNNIERVFRQEKDEQGKSITLYDDMPSEPISYTCVDPAEGSAF